MKYKTTKKAVTNGYYKIVSIGYCDLQHLLQYKNPAAYTCGIYGWNANVYDFNSIALVTGYRPFGNIHPDYKITNEYEKCAKKIVYNYSIEYEVRKELVNTLLKEYLLEVTGMKYIEIFDI